MNCNKRGIEGTLNLKFTQSSSWSCTVRWFLMNFIIKGFFFTLIFNFLRLYTIFIDLLIQYPFPSYLHNRSTSLMIYTWFNYYWSGRKESSSNRIRIIHTCLKFGKICHKKGIVRICDEKLFLGSIYEQVHGFWPMWHMTTVSTRSKHDPFSLQLKFSALSCRRSFRWLMHLWQAWYNRSNKYHMKWQNPKQSC